MRSRGAALPTILALVTVVLVAGLAMGSLSALSLQFNRAQMESTRSQFAARSALAVFLAKVYEHDTTRSDDEQLNPLKPAPFEVTELLDNGVQYEQDGYKVSLHFDREKPGYSTDNSTGEVPVEGWPDDDGIPRVAPFSLDLVFEVEHLGQAQYYRATLKRVWPFAVYSAYGAVVLMGKPAHASAPSGARGSHVIGDVYTQWDANQAFPMDKLKAATYGYGKLEQPSQLLANTVARMGWHIDFAFTDNPLLIGINTGLNPSYKPDLSTHSNDETVYYWYDSAAVKKNLGDTEDAMPLFDTPNWMIPNEDNSLEGDFVIDYNADSRNIRPIIFPPEDTNKFNGEIHVRRGLALDPLYFYKKEKAEDIDFEADGYTPVSLSYPPRDWEDKVTFSGTTVYDASEPFVLTETLRLSQGENSTGGPTSSHYKINGNVSNQHVFYCPEERKLCVRENHAGLQLQDVVLYVKGDLNLGADQFADPIKVYGSGATLIVDGTLVLGNAHFDAVDQGFVIFARRIVLTGGGEFRGLMIATEGINILSRSADDPLTIYGALMCGGYGGVQLRGTNVQHEPRYLKAVNGGGDFYLSAWQKVIR